MNSVIVYFSWAPWRVFPSCSATVVPLIIEPLISLKMKRELTLFAPSCLITCWQIRTIGGVNLRPCKCCKYHVNIIFFLTCLHHFIVSQIFIWTPFRFWRQTVLRWILQSAPSPTTTITTAACSICVPCVYICTSWAGIGTWDKWWFK